MDKKKLERILSLDYGAFPNTSRVEEENITIWFNQKTGEIYGAGPGNPRKRTRSCVSVRLRYDTNLMCPIAELVDNVIKDKPLRRVLDQVKYHRAMQRKRREKEEKKA